MGGYKGSAGNFAAIDSTQRGTSPNTHRVRFFMV
jgi:hypothetical protein